MKQLRRATLRAIGAGTALAAAPALRPAFAQQGAGAWPTKPIRIIVPFGSGSSTDVAARLIAPKISQKLGQPVVVENRAGATGMIGSEAVARAAPDGYTLVIGTVASHGTLQALKPDLTYNVLRDFEPISLLTSPPAIVVVHPSVPANTLKELAAYSRTLPNGLTYASSGLGGSGHLATELIALKTGAKLVHVPYKDANQAVTDTIAGHTSLMVYYSPVVPHLRSGKLRGLAMLSEKRAGFAPDVPTAIEQGVPDMIVTGWGALFGPAGLPEPIRDALYAAVKEALEDPTIRKTMADGGQDPMGLSPRETRRFVERDIAQWVEVAKATGLKIQ